MQQVEIKTIWNRNFVFILLVNILSTLGIFMMNSTITPYATLLGAGASLAGIISGMYYVFAMVCRPLSGVAANRISRKNTYIVFAAVMLVTALVMFVTDSIAVVTVFRMIQGIGYCFITTVTMALATELVPEDRLGEGIACFGLAQIISTSVGPAIGLFLSSAIGYKNLYLVAAGLFFLSIPLCAIIKSTYVPAYAGGLFKGVSLKEIVAPESIRPACVGLFFGMLNSVLMSYIALYATSLGIGGASGYFLVNGAAMFVSRSLTKSFADKKTLGFVAVLSGVFLISAMLILGFGHSTFMLLLAGAVFGIGYGILLPVTQTNCVRRPPMERRGSGTSTYSLGIDLGFSTGTMVAGVIAQSAGYSKMFLCFVIPGLFAIVIALLDDRIMKAKAM